MNSLPGVDILRVTPTRKKNSEKGNEKHKKCGAFSSSVAYIQVSTPSALRGSQLFIVSCKDN